MNSSEISTVYASTLLNLVGKIYKTGRTYDQKNSNWLFLVDPLCFIAYQFL